MPAKPKTADSDVLSNGEAPLPVPEACAEGQKDSPKREQIIEGARRMFLAKGFEGASMQDIARTAEVSKGTLYVYFDGKEAMFDALVERECGRLQEAVRRIGTGEGELEDELLRIGQRIVETLLRHEVLASMRMIIGAAEKFPDLARKIYAAGPMRSKQTLAAYFDLRRSRGDLAIEDCTEAAMIFSDLLVSGLQRSALLMMDPPGQEELDRHVARRVDMFLSIFRPRR